MKLLTIAQAAALLLLAVFGAYAGQNTDTVEIAPERLADRCVAQTSLTPDCNLDL